jgi:hypothetical protein
MPDPAGVALEKPIDSARLVGLSYDIDTRALYKGTQDRHTRTRVSLPKGRSQYAGMPGIRADHAKRCLTPVLFNGDRQVCMNFPCAHTVVVGAG